MQLKSTRTAFNLENKVKKVIKMKEKQQKPLLSVWHYKGKILEHLQEMSSNQLHFHACDNAALT